MMYAMTGATPYAVPAEPGRWSAFLIAVAIHGLLVLFLWFSVSWHNETPTAIEAEIWSPVAESAAPKPEPQSEAEIEPPMPEPQRAPEPVRAPEIEVPKIDPDIALRVEKKRKEELAREEERDRKLLEKKRLEQAKKEKEKTDAQEKRRADEEKKLAEQKRKAQEKIEQAKLDKIRAAELNRMQTQATNLGSGGSGGSGSAIKSTGSTDAGYLGRIAAKIKSNTAFAVPEGLAGNPAVEYTVELFPDGSIRRPIKKNRPSGVPGFDEAVLNAIEKSQPFPPDKTGNVPSSISVSHKPKD